MKPANWMLTLFAVLALAVAITILFWLRGRSAERIGETVSAAVGLFDPPETVLGEPTEARVDFEAAEALVQTARRNPFIRELILTKVLPGRAPDRDEVPIVPFDLRVREGPEWRARLEGMSRAPLSDGNEVCGYLYFELDRSAERTIGWAIAAASIALAAALLLLVGRLHAQAGALSRAGSLLDQRTRELIRLERLALAGQLSASLLHDLKKPVLNIRHRLEDLKEPRPPGTPEGAPDERLKEIEAEIALFFQMLSESSMERFVRSDRVGAEYVDAAETLRAAARLVHYERNAVKLVEDFEDGLPPILAPPFRLVQVFSNLILNAYQSLKGRGSVTLSTRAREGGVEIRITDDGPGIPPEVLPRVFDPFFTTKPESEGSGLGLAISRLIVAELKGTIIAECAPGGGASFVVFLPAS